MSHKLLVIFSLSRRIGKNNLKKYILDIDKNLKILFGVLLDTLTYGAI